jgi:hypothetical protein
MGSKIRPNALAKDRLLCDADRTEAGHEAQEVYVEEMPTEVVAE